ncbi:hypothetical protein [Nocardioides sp.]|uniref:hypothetical protein n=1 Tax=Nocardioides sp. TaxID=35761 RepID=UPI003D106502
MSTPVLVNVVYVLTALAGLVVVLTRVRLARALASGAFPMGRGLLNLHTVAGVLALVIWVVFLVADEETFAGGSLVGIIALFFWWVTALVGLMTLARWLPSRGRHAGDTAIDSSGLGPWLSLLAHLGVLVGVVVFTWAYLSSAV